MPTRHVPIRIYEAHEVHPSLEYDWTLGTGDLREEKKTEANAELVSDGYVEVWAITTVQIIWEFVVADGQVKRRHYIRASR